LTIITLLFYVFVFVKLFQDKTEGFIRHLTNDATIGRNPSQFKTTAISGFKEKAKKSELKQSQPAVCSGNLAQAISAKPITNCLKFKAALKMTA